MIRHKGSFPTASSSFSSSSFRSELVERIFFSKVTSLDGLPLAAWETVLAKSSKNLSLNLSANMIFASTGLLISASKPRAFAMVSRSKRAFKK